MRILILTGGTLCSNALERIHAFAPDRILAADAGIGHCMRLNLVPDEALGDFDSAAEEAIAYMQEHQIPVTTFPAEKDDTDTELALKVAMEQAGPGGKILLLGATGTRMDHTLANIFLLKQAVDSGVRCEIADDHNRIILLKGPDVTHLHQDPVLRGVPGQKSPDNISLLPVFGDAWGVTLRGFYYPLTDQTMKAGETLGISNYLVEEEGVIQLRQGYLLVVRAVD